MYILDRYIIKELAGPFVFGLAAFTCILAGSTVLFYYIGEAVKYGIPILTILQVIIYKLPGVIAYAFPMSTLLAAILAFSRLSADLEIMALRAAGIGFNRLIIPVILLGVLISGVSLWFNESVVPRSAESAQNIMRSFKDDFKPKIKQNVNFTEYDPKTKDPVRTINVAAVEDDMLKNVTVAEFENGKLARIIRAKSGKWNNTGQWIFYDGIMHYFPTENKKRVTIIEFKKEFVDIKINPTDLTKRKKYLEEMTILDLKERIDFKTRTGDDPTEDKVYFHLRLSVPFACLIFSILGATVGLRPHRSSSAIGLGISLVVIIIYYILLSVSMGMGLAHAIPPSLAAWLPNIVIGSAAFYLLRRIATQ
jgi:lipopolysaccharide export system permease protein